MEQLIKTARTTELIDFNKSSCWCLQPDFMIQGIE